MVPVRRPRPTSGSLTARRSADARAPGHSDSEVAVEQLTHHCVRAVSPSGGLVVLHVPSGTYLKLDGSASTIVDLLIEHGDAEHATAALAARFAIPMERAGVDVAAVVTALTSLRASRASHGRRPTASGALSVFRSWWRLSNPLKAAVVKAMAMVLVVEGGLRTMDIARLAARMGVPLATGTSEPRRGDDDGDVDSLCLRERRAYWAAVWVLDRWVFDGTCLRRALVTGFFLRRHHPELHLGLIGEGETSHAWVEAEGMTFNALPVTGIFTGRWTGDPSPQEGRGDTL